MQNKYISFALLYYLSMYYNLENIIINSVGYGTRSSLCCFPFRQKVGRSAASCALSWVSLMHFHVSFQQYTDRSGTSETFLSTE